MADGALNFAIQDASGNAISGAQVSVYRESDSGLATIYSDIADTPMTNPIVTDSSGQVTFFAAANSYKVVAVKGPFTRTWRYMQIFAVSTVRTKLISAGTFYVRTDGDDSNDGSANTAGAAFETIQAAVDYILNNRDLNGNYATVKLGVAGTYSGGVIIYNNTVGVGGIIIEGDTSAPQNYIIDGGANDAIRADNAQVGVKGVELRSSSQSGLAAIGLGKIDAVGVIRFGACAYAHLSATLGGFIHISDNYTIAGNAVAHYAITSAGVIRVDATTVTASGTPTITIFAGVSDNGVLMAAGPTGTGITWSGSYTNVAVKASLSTGGAIFTNGLGRTYLPGAAAVVTDGTGVYDHEFAYGVKGADIASASTINLSTSTGDYVDVTGTTAITAITLQEGQERTIRFTGILTFTNGANLVLPGGANITTAAGDYAKVRGRSGGVVHCVMYTRANGQPLVGGSSTAAVPRNILARNGGLEVWQRGAGSSASISVAASTTAYTADGFYLATGANQASTVSAQAGITNGSQLCARVQRNSGQTGTGTMVFAIPLSLEEIVRTRGSKVVVSFSIRAGANWSPSSGTLAYSLYGGTAAVAKRGNVAYTGEVQIASGSVNLTAGGSAQQVVSSLSAAVVAANTAQMELLWAWSPTGTAGAADYFEIDDVQIECATAAPSPAVFDRVAFIDELMACKRHYQKSFPYSTAPANNVNSPRYAGFAWSVSGLDTQGIEFQPEMRATPTVTPYAPSNIVGTGVWSIYDGASAFQAAATTVIQGPTTTRGFNFTLTGLTLTSKDAHICYGYWVADAGI